MFHCKDMDPSSTIHQARLALATLGALPYEHWHNTGTDVFTCRLSLSEHTDELGTNGKGVSKPLALASAYGEMLERLQNQYLYPIHVYYTFDQGLRTYLGFEYSPREEALDAKLAANLCDSLYARISATAGASIANAVRGGRADFLMGPAGRWACVGYYDPIEGADVTVPVQLVRALYGSNGMAAGNTIAEALVQGICEVIERFIYRRILDANDGFPTISRDLLKQSFPSEELIIQEVEDNSHLRVVVKDCSLGLGLPAVCSLMVNGETGRYLVKIGVHPNPHVALERALTELLQGTDVAGIGGVPLDPAVPQDYITSDRNFRAIFKNGHGYCPMAFMKDSGTSGIPWSQAPAKESTNADYLGSILRKCNDLGWRMLFRDVTFTQIKAIQVIAPGVSEVNRPETLDWGFMERDSRASRLMRAWNHLLPEDLRFLSSHYDGPCENWDGDSISARTHLPISGPWARISASFVLGILSHTAAEFDRSDRFLAMAAKSLAGSGAGTADNTLYLNCVRAVASMLHHGISWSDASDVCAVFFGVETLGKAQQTLHSPEIALQQVAALDCPVCGKCAAKSWCSYEYIVALHKQIKERMACGLATNEEITQVISQARSRPRVRNACGESDASRSPE